MMIFSERALIQSKRLLKEAAELMAKQPQNGFNRGFGADMGANLQLYISTGEKQYLDKFQELLWPALDRNVSVSLLTALDAIPYMDASFCRKAPPVYCKV